MKPRCVCALSALLLAAACGSDPDARPAGASGSAAGAAGAPQPTAARPESYAKVADILQRSCSYVRCHDGPLIGGTLRLGQDGDYASVLLGVTACQYDRMKRVEPGDPEHSWLWVKLTAAFRGASDPYANYIEFTPEPGWDPEQRGCRDQTEDGVPLFGQRMPLTAPNMLPDDELQAIRRWIEQGAPFER